MSERPDGLHELFQRYRAACPEPEASAAFMPGLWERIESRRNWTWKLRGYARSLVTVAATLSLFVLAFELSPLSSASAFLNGSYVDALDDDQAPETLTYMDVVNHVDEL